MRTLRRLRRASCSSGVSWLRAGTSFSPLARLPPRLGSGLSSGITSPSLPSSSTKSSLSALAFLAGRPGRRPVDLLARGAGAAAPACLAAAFFAVVFFAAVFFAAVFLAAVFLAAVFFAAVFEAGAPPSASSPTVPARAAGSRVGAPVLVCLAGSVAWGESRVSGVTVAFRRRQNTGGPRGHGSL